MIGGKPHNEWDFPRQKPPCRFTAALNNPADTDKGWTVEIAFPWKALLLAEHTRVSPARRPKASNGAYQLSRVRNGRSTHTNGAYQKIPMRHLKNNWVWSPQGVVNMHRP